MGVSTSSRDVFVHFESGAHAAHAWECGQLCTHRCYIGFIQQLVNSYPAIEIKINLTQQLCGLLLFKLLSVQVPSLFCSSSVANGDLLWEFSPDRFSQSRQVLPQGLLGRVLSQLTHPTSLLAIHLA